MAFVGDGKGELEPDDEEVKHDNNAVHWRKNCGLDSTTAHECEAISSSLKVKVACAKHS